MPLSDRYLRDRPRDKYLRPNIDFQYKGAIASSGETPEASFEHLLSLMNLKGFKEGEGYFDTTQLGLGDAYWDLWDAKSADEKAAVYDQAINKLREGWEEAGSPYVKAYDMPEGWKDDPFYAEQAEALGGELGDFRAHFTLGNIGQSKADTVHVQGLEGEYWNKNKYEDFLAERPEDMSRADYVNYMFGTHEQSLGPSEFAHIIPSYDIPLTREMYDDMFHGGPLKKDPGETKRTYFAELAHAHDYDKSDKSWFGRVIGRSAAQGRIQGQSLRYGENVYKHEHTDEYKAHYDPDNPTSQVSLESNWRSSLRNLFVPEYLNKFVDKLGSKMKFNR